MMLDTRQYAGLYRQYISRDLSDSPKDVLEIIYKELDIDSISAIAHNPTISKKIQIAISNTNDHLAKRGLLNNKNIDTDTIIRCGILNISNHLQLKIVNDNNYLLRAKFAKKFYIEEEVQHLLLDDEHFSVRVALAHNKYIKKSTKNELLKDRAINVKLAIISSKYFTNHTKSIVRKSLRHLCFW